MDVRSLFQNYSLSTYTRVGPVFVRGEGSWLWDEAGKKYLDLFPGWGVSILGHCHPKVVAAIESQAKKLIHLPNNLFFAEQAQLAEKLVRLSFPGKAFFANSGAEAVEGAIKFSRVYGKKTGRHEIVVMRNSFHGRTFGALSATAQDKYKEPFVPLLASFPAVEFNDFDAFKKAVNKKTVAVMLELVQGEGGVNVATGSYVAQVKKYCREHNLLFIVDEVQTGMGRTGKLFCYENYSFTPDIMVLSKGLGAGVPISAVLAGPAVAAMIKPGMHASTFGGSPLVTAVSRRAFEVIEEEKLLDNVNAQGRYLFDRLTRLKEKVAFIKEVRGLGLMLGIELKVKKAQPIFQGALERKLIINAPKENVLRIMPALNVTRNELDQGLAVLEEVLKGV